MSKEDRTRKWNDLILQYIAHHKYLKKVGKMCIGQGEMGRLGVDVQKELSYSLIQIDNGLVQLKNFFKPYLTVADTTDMFVEDKFKNETQRLLQQVDVLRAENESLKLRNGNHDALLDENARLKTDLEQKLQRDNATAISQRKQEEFDELFKVQNGLIEDLGRQLAECQKDREMFKGLNKDLEAELRKNRGYTERTTLKVGDGRFVDRELRDLRLQNEELDSQLRYFDAKYRFEAADERVGAETKEVTVRNGDDGRDDDGKSYKSVLIIK